MRDELLSFHFIMNHVPSFANFFGPKGYGRFVKVRLYQEPLMLSEGGAAQGGRRWGKTFTCVFKILNSVFKYPRKEQLISVFRRAHMENVFEECIKIINSVEFFKEYLKTGRELGSVKRDVLHRIDFKNGHTVFAISVGEDPHATQIKGRSPRVRHVDEAQDFPQAAANILASTADPEGCEEYYYGVVDGRRDTPFYKVLEKSQQFKKKVFKFSRRYDPNFNQYDLEKLGEQIEGGASGDKFGQEVDAEHGSPSAAVWNIDDVIACMEQLNLSDQTTRKMRDIVVTPRDYTKGDPIENLFADLFRSADPCIMGIDVGDAQPTMVLPFILEEGRWTLRNKIELRDHMDTLDQTDIILYLINQMNVQGIGIDITSSPAIADILASKSEAIKDCITRVRFNSNVIYGMEKIETEEQIAKHYQQDGKRVKMGDIIELKQRAKNYSTEKVRNLMKNRLLNFYYHPDLIEDFTSEEVFQSTSGSLIRTPDTVHFPEALRCFVMAYIEKYGDGVSVPTETLENIFPKELGGNFFGRSNPSATKGIDMVSMFGKK